MSRWSIQAETGLIFVKSMSELRKLLTFSTKLVLNQLKLDNCVIQGIVSKDQRLNWTKLARVCQKLIWQMIRNIKDWNAKIYFLQDPGYVETVNLHAAWYEPRSHPLLMSTQSIQGSNYIVYHSSKSSIYMKIRIKALYKFELQFTLN